jgi:branched-chain amino acid transport system ATP-binding protein
VEAVFAALRALNQAHGLSILVAEQNSTVALRYASRAYVLEHGSVVLEGDAATLRQNDDIKNHYLGLAHAPSTAGRITAAV